MGFTVLVLSIGWTGCKSNLRPLTKPPNGNSLESTANAERGELLFEDLPCTTCHDGPSRGVNVPPGLEFAGNKFQRDWLERYLLDPYPIRWVDTNTRPDKKMPDLDLTSQQAKDLVAFLMTEKDEVRLPPTNIDWSLSDSTQIAKGRKLVDQYACTGCHIIENEGTKLGPELTRVGSKLQPDYIYRFLLNPKQVIPETPMKDNQLWEDEAEAITRYLITLQ